MPPVLPADAPPTPPEDALPDAAPSEGEAGGGEVVTGNEPALRPDLRASNAAEGHKLGPIGPERLKALREAIQKGTYPTDADVVGGLTRMLGGQDERPEA